MKISKRLKAAEIEVLDIIDVCEKAKYLEDSGEYAEAMHVMSHWWKGIGERPDVEELSPGKRAHILSRVGSISGWLGSMQQVPGAQERSKDLISEGANIFESIHEHENWAEARSDLAVCYWREGAFDEARIILQDVTCSGLISSSELKAKILLRLVTVEISTKHFETSANLLGQIEILLKNTKNSLLSGKFFFYRAFTSRSQGEEKDSQDLLVSAIKDYSRAALFYKKIKHDLFSANVENNLGNVYRLLRDYKNAHLHFDQAISMYLDLGDRLNAALVYENKAQAFLAQEELEQAEIAACSSVDIVRDGDEKSVLTESLTTLGVVLSRGGNVDYAVSIFQEAKETALSVGDAEGAGDAVLTQLEELYKEFTPIVFRNLYLEADDLLKNSPKISNVDRLQKIAKKQFEIGNRASLLKNEKYFDWVGFCLPNAVHAYEKDLILKALNEAEGRLTRAAKLLGVSHQSLSLILHQRHKDLQEFRIVRKPRANYE